MLAMAIVPIANQKYAILAVPFLNYINYITPHCEKEIVVVQS